MNSANDTALSIGTAVSLDGLQAGISSIEANIAAMEGRLNSRIKGLGNAVDKASEQAGSSIKKISEAGGDLSGTFDNVSKAAAKIGVAFTAQSLISQIINVRGEFQKLEVAFNTMLGSKEKANTLMQQLVQTAAITPFDLAGVANGAKQLLAYGDDVKNVNDDLIRLGNIAAGLSQPLNDIVYLYGTTMTQGRLYTQDLNQFTGRGIPMIRELANVMGVAESKVKDLVEEGKIGFPEVQKVIRNLTDEGGMFYNLMEEQSKTISGQIANIEDAISSMFNKIGQQSEGIINGALDTVSSLIENYEQVGRILLGLVATYGAYRTACMLVTAVHAVQATGIGALTTAEAIHYGWLVATEKAQKLLNATMLLNPFVLTASLIAGVVAALISMKTETELMREAEKDYQAQKQRTIDAEQEHIRKMEQLCEIAGDEAVATNTRREALNKLELKYPDIFAKYNTEYDKLKNIKKIKEEISALEKQKSITQPKNELSSVEKRIKELEEKKKTERYQRYTSSLGAYSMKVGGLSEQQEAELKNLRNKRKNLQTQVRKNDVNSYYEDLTGISNDKLAAQIKQRKTLLAVMKMQEKNYGRITDGDNKGTYSKDELRHQLNKLESEQNKRNAKKDSSADWGKSARKSYEDALKKYNQFINNSSNKLTQEEYEENRKKLKDALDSAKKEYDAAQPSTNKDVTKQQKKEEEAEKRRVEKRKQLANELVQIEEETKQSEIDTMEEGTAKKLAMIDLDYNKQKEKLNKQERDWKDKNKEAGVKTEKDGLTKEQSDALKDARGQNDEKQRKLTEKALKEEADMQTEAMNEYYIKYGNMQEKILALTEEYERKKKDAKTEGDKLSLKKELDNELKNIKIDEFKKSIDWDSIFGDMGKQSITSLQHNLERIKAYLKENSNSMDIPAIKDMQEAITSMENEIASRNPFTALAKSLQDIAKYKNELVNALNEYAAAQKEITAAQLEYNDALAYQQQLEEQVEQGKLSKDSEEYKSALEAITNAENDITKAKEKSNQAEKNALNARNNITVSYKSFSSQLKNVGSVIKDIGGKAKNLASIFSDNVADSIEKSIDFITDMLDAATTVIDAIGDTGKSVASTMQQTAQTTGTAVQSTATATATAISTVEKASVILAVISAALQVATAIANLFNNDDKRQKEIERLQERIDQLQWELDNADAVRLQNRTGSALDKVRNILAQTQDEVLKLHLTAQQYNNYWLRSIAKNIYKNEVYQKSVKKLADYYASLDYTADKALGGDKYKEARSQLENIAQQQILLQRQINAENNNKKVDHGKVADWQRDMQENAEKMISIINDMMDDIIGYSAEDLAKTLGDAFLDAFKEGEDAAEAWGKKVDEIVSDILKKLMIQEVLEKPIGKIFNEYKKKWFGEDGTKFSIEAVKSSLGDFSSELNDLVSKMQDAFNDLPEDMKTLLYGDAKREGTSKGIATASQDSVDENNARLTTIQGHTYSINQGVIELNRTSNAMLVKLTAIESNTAKTNDKLDTMNTNIRNIKSNVDDIQTKGLRLRS